MPPTLTTAMPATLTKTLPKPYRMFHGGELPEVTLAYETWGTLSKKKDNAILLTTGLSPGSHARSTPENSTPGWWEGMIGPGRALDTDRFFVVCNNSLGSCHGSTGPASIDPRTGKKYRLTFPELALEDIAATSHELLRSLGIERLHTVIGSSLGGMTALAYAVLFPDEVEAVASISAAAHASPFAIALRSIQREAVRRDPAWNGGDYAPDHPPSDGMMLARKLGTITYRSATEWTQRFGRQRVKERTGPFGIEFEIEAYLQHQAERFVSTFDPNCYLYLSHAMDEFDLAEHGGSLEAAYQRIRARKILVVGVTSDILFPIEQQQDLADGLRSAGRDVRFERLPSIQGHDSFLIDLERFGPVVGSFLREV